MNHDKKSKIIATIGLASCRYDVLKKLFLAGVDVFRLNFSHGDHEFHLQTAKMIRQLELELGRSVSIMMDLQGPKIRIGVFDEGKVSLKTGSMFVLDLNKDFGNSRRVSLPHPEIYAALRCGSDVLVDDGKILLRVVENYETRIVTEVINGGVLSNKKGVNIPDVLLPISALTEKDKKDLEIVRDIDANWLAISFVQSAADVVELRKLVDKDIGIIAKIEKPSAVADVDSILDVADAIMIARGDLGVEMPFEKIPGIQAKLISAAKRKKKPVVVATQMLESMTKCHVPTRAEAADVALAIKQGADAVMLSAETASGDFPEAAVKAMAQIARQSEVDNFDNLHDFGYAENLESDAFAKAASEMSFIGKISKIALFTDSGETALRIVHARPTADVVAFSSNLQTVRMLCLVGGVFPVFVEKVYNFSQMLKMFRQKIPEIFGEQDDNRVLVVAGIPFGQTNLLHIFKFGDEETFDIF